MRNSSPSHRHQWKPIALRPTASVKPSVMPVRKRVMLIYFGTRPFEREFARLKSSPKRNPPWLPMFCNSSTSATTPTMEFWRPWLMLKNTYTSNATPKPFSSGAIPRAVSLDMLVNIPLMPPATPTKGIFFSNSGRMALLMNTAITTFPAMPPTAPSTPPNRPPSAYERKLAIFSGRGKGCIVEDRMPMTIHTIPMTTVGNSFNGCLKTCRPWFKAFFRYWPTPIFSFTIFILWDFGFYWFY